MHPFTARAFAIDLPIPREPPVTTATREKAEGEGERLVVKTDLREKNFICQNECEIMISFLDTFN